VLHSAHGYDALAVMIHQMPRRAPLRKLQVSAVGQIRLAGARARGGRL